MKHSLPLTMDHGLSTSKCEPFCYSFLKLVAGFDNAVFKD